MRTAGRKPMFNEINITPLTDIFLVLLIIMMVVAPMLDTTGLKVAVPSMGPSEDTKVAPKTVELFISSTGTYSIKGASVSAVALVSKLQSLKAETPDGVIIKAHPDASHNALTMAMDAAQSAGISKVAVMSDSSSSSS